MKNIVSALLLTASVLTINAQEKDPALLKIGDKDVNLSEFNAIYNKNNSKEKATEESIQEYLDLYIKFKLKVREAEDLGYDTLPKFTKELAGYRGQLALPYLTDKEVTEGLIKEAYERMKWDVRASHILIKVGEGASSHDTLVAFNKAIKARKRILGGEDFVSVAKEVSTDPSVQKNGGDLGYFSVLHMVYPFESAAYQTEVGSVSLPVRTKFGYHIIKVVDKRAARGTIKVAHIY
jgi:peptidyl-prolyl cis-trans isomerase SurA